MKCLDNGWIMQDKITWYEEVLAQDPASPLFYNLAQLYLKQGDRDKALTSLQSGVDRNPAHAQARLLLIQLLVEADRKDEARCYVDPLANALGSCSHFWLLWSEKAQDEGHTDVAAALGFIGLDIHRGPLSWVQVMEKGLEALGPETSSRYLKEDREEMEAGHENSRVEAELEDTWQRPDEAAWDVYVPDPSEGTQKIASQESLPPDGYRTVTMADILAGQGEYASAIEIYSQLLEEETGRDRRQQIQDRIHSLKRRMQEVDTSTDQEGQQESQKQETGAVGVKGHKDAKGPESGYASIRPEKQEILRRLDRLAARLEAKG